jgi:hypothetical protein
MARLISSLPALRPVSITDTNGRHVSITEHDKSVTSLLEYVQEQTIIMYQHDASKLIREIATAKRLGSANSFARQRGYKSASMGLPHDIKAKSRINELILHKLVSETASYVRSTNPMRNEPSFPLTMNLGAVNSQMASITGLHDDRLTLRFKCWDKDVLITFRVPGYILKRSILKWSLPRVNMVHGVPAYTFAIMEASETREPSQCSAGVDLGRVKPFVMVALNKHGAIINQGEASPKLTRLNRKRERIIAEKKCLTRKIRAYAALGKDATTLITERERKGNKARILGHQVALLTGSEIAKRLQDTTVSTLRMENLKWVTGSTYGSKWNHSAQQEAIAHATARIGVTTKQVNPKNTSQSCSRCGARTTHDTSKRTIHCPACDLAMDRDYNAAINIAHITRTHPASHYGNRGGKCSGPDGPQLMGLGAPVGALGSGTVIGIAT